MDWHAQYEIRAYGDAIARCARAVAPLAYAAFEEHVLHGRRLSAVRARTCCGGGRSGRSCAPRSRPPGCAPTRRRELLEKLGLEAPGERPRRERALPGGVRGQAGRGAYGAAVRRDLPRLDGPGADRVVVVGRARPRPGGAPASGGGGAAAAAVRDAASRSTSAARLHDRGPRRARRALELRGEGKVTLWIGGADGLDAELVARRRRAWRLSDLTLAHELALAVLLEQLYRVEVAAGGPSVPPGVRSGRGHGRMPVHERAWPERAATAPPESSCASRPTLPET